MILKAFRSQVEKEDQATGKDGTYQDPSVILFPFLHVTSFFSVQWDEGKRIRAASLL
jgi:hypothetical protein